MPDLLEFSQASIRLHPDLGNWPADDRAEPADVQLS